MGGRTGFRIVGGSSGGMRAVAGAGDVNGDGRGDLVVGDIRGQRGYGGADVVFGRRYRRPVDVAHLGSAGFAIRGAAKYWDSGYAVAGGGDVNGDGRADVVLSAPQGHRTQWNTAGGGAWVVFGSRSRRTVQLARLGRRGIELRGSGPAWAGFAVGIAGRVNADRLADVVLTSGGSLAIVYGRQAPGRVRAGAAGRPRPVSRSTGIWSPTAGTPPARAAG